MHVVELGGYDYIAMGGLGFTKVPMSGSGLAAGFSPSKMFSSTVAGTSAGGYQLAGTESKNGVSADHYTASAGTLSGYGSMMGVRAWRMRRPLAASRKTRPGAATSGSPRMAATR